MSSILELADLKRSIAELKESDLFASAKVKVDRSCKDILDRLPILYTSLEDAKARIYIFEKNLFSNFSFNSWCRTAIPESWPPNSLSPAKLSPRNLKYRRTLQFYFQGLHSDLYKYIFVHKVSLKPMCMLRFYKRKKLKIYTRDHYMWSLKTILHGSEVFLEIIRIGSNIVVIMCIYTPWCVSSVEK